MIIFKRHISFASQHILRHHVFLVVFVQGVPSFNFMFPLCSSFTKNARCARRFQMNQNVEQGGRLMLSGEWLGMEWIVVYRKVVNIDERNDKKQNDKVIIPPFNLFAIDQYDDLLKCRVCVSYWSNLGNFVSLNGSFWGKVLCLKGNPSRDG